MQNYSWNKLGFALALLVAVGCFALAEPTNAKSPVTSLFSAEGKVLRTYPTIAPGAHVAVGDVSRDGIPEIIVGSPQGTQSRVRILRLDGSTIRDFPVRDVKNSPAVHVAVGDVTGDGQAEIVVGFGSGTTPEVRVYTQHGKRLSAFLAFGKGFRGGVNVAVGDVTGDGLGDVVTSAGRGGGPFVVTYTYTGERLEQFLAYPAAERSGVTVGTLDADGNGTVDILTTMPKKSSLVKVFDAGGIVHATFRAAAVTPGTVHSAQAPTTQLIVGTVAGSPGVVTSYTADGQEGNVKFYPFGKTFSAGVVVAAVPNSTENSSDILVVPGTLQNANGQTGRSIVVDISDQRMYRYEDGRLVATHVVSTGKWSMPTPIGSFKVHNKLGTAYSRRYALYMDNWMAFTPDGAYGIHSLPYWRLKNGSIYYEGTNHLGIRVSHGCIRLSPAESKVVFQWASVGIPVTITQ